MKARQQSRLESQGIGNLAESICKESQNCHETHKKTETGGSHGVLPHVDAKPADRTTRTVFSENVTHLMDLLPLDLFVSIRLLWQFI